MKSENYEHETRNCRLLGRFNHRRTCGPPSSLTRWEPSTGTARRLSRPRGIPLPRRLLPQTSQPHSPTTPEACGILTMPYFGGQCRRDHHLELWHFASQQRGSDFGRAPTTYQSRQFSCGKRLPGVFLLGLGGDASTPNFHSETRRCLPSESSARTGTMPVALPC